MKKKIYTFLVDHYSDDCAWIDGAVGRFGQELSENDIDGIWFEFKIDKKVIGKCRMIFDCGWKFEIKSEKEILAGKALEPTRDEEYEDCQDCDEEEESDEE